MAVPKLDARFLLSVVVLIATIASIRSLCRVDGNDSPQASSVSGLAQSSGDPLPGNDASSHPGILRELSDRERNEAIKRNLLKSVRLRAGTQPLETLLVDLAKQNDIPLEIDQATIRDEGVALDQPVELHDADVTLRSALRLICDQYQLNTVIRQGIVSVTTSARAGQILEARVHSVGALVPEDDYSELISLITWAVDPDSWSDLTGPPPVYCVPAAHAVVFRQTTDVHEKVAVFLADLERQTTVDREPPHADPIRDRERSIRKKLMAVIDVDCEADSLDEALTLLAKKHELPLWLSKLDQIDEDPRRGLPVSLHLRNVRLDSALDRILRSRDLAWVIEDEVVRILPRDRFLEHVVTRVYDVHDLATTSTPYWPPPDSQSQPIGAFGGVGSGGAGGGVFNIQDDARKDAEAQTKPSVESRASRRVARSLPYGFDLQDVHSAILAAIHADPWFRNQDYDVCHEFRDTIVVRQPAESHERIEILLHQLREAAKKQAADVRKAATDDEALIRFVYDISDYSYPTNELAKLIVEEIAPSSWKAVGGTATIHVQPTNLVIRQTRAVHREIVKLLYEVVLHRPAD